MATCAAPEAARKAAKRRLGARPKLYFVPPTARRARRRRASRPLGLCEYRGGKTRRARDARRLESQVSHNTTPKAWRSAARSCLARAAAMAHRSTRFAPRVAAGAKIRVSQSPGACPGLSSQRKPHPSRHRSSRARRRAEGKGKKTREVSHDQVALRLMKSRRRLMDRALSGLPLGLMGLPNRGRHPRHQCYPPSGGCRACTRPSARAGRGAGAHRSSLAQYAGVVSAPLRACVRRLTRRRGGGSLRRSPSARRRALDGRRACGR